MFRFLIILFVGASLIGIQNGQAMELPMLSVPEEFPGHTSRPITGVIKVPDHFDPLDYQQNEHEEACIFNSMVAGIMHTPYGRKKIQEIFTYQDENKVFIRGYFPPIEILRNNNIPYQFHVNYAQEVIKDANENLEAWASVTNPDDHALTTIKDLETHTRNLKLKMEKLPALWNQVLALPMATVSVPKKFVTREEDSFPQDNPEWLNLIQQAYMKLTKNRILREYYIRNGYTADEEITEEDKFGKVPFCVLSRVEKLSYTENYPNFPHEPYLNLICPPSDEPLIFFPLIDREIKKVEIFTDQENGLEFSKIRDLKIEKNSDNNDQPFNYTFMNYQSCTDFAHTHDLTKFLLTGSNVVQFSTSGHEVALFFSKDKVYYYDNLKEDTSQRKEVYGAIGPIYEEAHYFKGQDLDQMSEEDFLQRVFQEIHFRCSQIAKIEDGEYPSWPQTTIKFFKQPLSLNEL